MKNLLGVADQDEHKDIEVVRLFTSYWCDKRGMHIRKDLVPMKRKSCGYQLLDEDCSNGGPDETLQRVENLYECDDGLYIVKSCNESTDWETGVMDDYDYILVPFKE